MEVNHVIKIVIVVLILPFFGHTQEKYLLYNPEKDSILNKEGNLYYIIDENLFDINRYNQIDTIYNKEIKNSSVNKLRDEGRSTLKEYFGKLKEGVPVIIKESGIETFNDLFELIYVLEKLPDCGYKRTRVWWIDY